MDAFDDLINGFIKSCAKSGVFQKIRELAYGVINCTNKKTLTGFITSVGKQHLDWSAYYRLFSKSRIDTDKLLEEVCLEGVKYLHDSEHILLHMDDTLVGKTGKKVYGTSWRRDPLGPPFQTNLIWAQRYLQTSLAIPEKKGIGQSRAIPIGLKHCPTPKKPGKKASEEEMQYYKEQQKQMKLNQKGIEEIARFRTLLDNNGLKDRKMVLSVDGSYTNTTVLKALPDNVSLIGRIRKDAKLQLPPTNQPGTGRRRVYGEDIPTPEQIRQSDKYKWTKVEAWAAGKIHKFDIKVVENLMWRKAGQKHRLRLIVIRPLAYRLTKKSRILYRNPAYLICTDPQLDLQYLLQAYLWRWEIEVNIGDEKSLFGVGKAQVRKKESVESLPAFIAAIYATLHLAEIKCRSMTDKPIFPRPKWYIKKSDKRITTGDMLKTFKAQLYCKALGFSFSHFVNTQSNKRKPRNKIPSNVFNQHAAQAHCF